MDKGGSVMLQEAVEQIEKTAKSVVNEIHTALPGKIVSFDSVKCVATVQPLGRYVMSDGKSLEYPAITEAPVVFPFSQSAGAGIGFPVKAGDGCLIILSEVELDQWRSEAKSEGSLRFDLTNAIAIPGLLRSGGVAVVKACAMNAVVVSAGGSEIVVSGSGITISGNLTVQGNIDCTGSISGG